MVTTGLFKPQSCFKAKAIRLGLSAPSFGNRNIDHIGTCIIFLSTLTSLIIYFLSAAFTQ